MRVRRFRAGRPNDACSRRHASAAGRAATASPGAPAARGRQRSLPNRSRIPSTAGRVAGCGRTRRVRTGPAAFARQLADADRAAAAPRQAVSRARLSTAVAIAVTTRSSAWRLEASLARVGREVPHGGSSGDATRRQRRARRRGARLVRRERPQPQLRWSATFVSKVSSALICSRPRRQSPGDRRSSAAAGRAPCRSKTGRIATRWAHAASPSVWMPRPRPWAPSSRRARTALRSARIEQARGRRPGDDYETSGCAGRAILATKLVRPNPTTRELGSSMHSPLDFTGDVGASRAPQRSP